jgi:hypothetical protein
MHFARPVSGFARNDGGHTALLFLRDIRLRPEQSLADILFVDDIVAVKNTPGLVATNRHIDAFRHTGAYHIPYRCPAQVIKELPRYTCFLTRIAPCLVETINLHPTAMQDIGQQVLNAIPTHTQLGLRDRALAEVLCITGMRIAEALSLHRAQDVRAAHAKYLSYDIDQGEKTDGKSPRQ